MKMLHNTYTLHKLNAVLYMTKMYIYFSIDRHLHKSTTAWIILFWCLYSIIDDAGLLKLLLQSHLQSTIKYLRFYDLCISFTCFFSSCDFYLTCILPLLFTLKIKMNHFLIGLVAACSAQLFCCHCSHCPAVARMAPGTLDSGPTSNHGLHLLRS